MWIYCSITKLSKVFTDGWKKNYLDMIVRTHRKGWTLYKSVYDVAFWYCMVHNTDGSVILVWH